MCLYSLYSINSRCLIVSALLFVILHLPTVGIAMSMEQQHEQAVRLARKGDHAAALATLEVLHNHYPSDQGITGDMIVIAGWAGQYERARKLFEQAGTDAYPEYVQYAMVNVYRSLDAPETGLRILESLLKHHPDNMRWQVHRALLLIDMGQLAMAEKVLEELADRAISKDIYLARGYLHETSRDWLAALADYQNGLSLAPQDRELLKKRVEVLNQVHAPALALHVLQGSGNIMDDAEVAWLLTGRAAELLRWASGVGRDFGEIRLFAMRALACQIEALSLLDPSDANDAQRRQVYLDMLITLRNLRQMENLQSLYAMLAREGDMPDYARQALADSLLATHQPAQAGVLYKKLIEKNPKNYQASLGLFYAHVEDENFADAFHLIDSMVRHEPRYLTFWDSPQKYPNEQYLNLNVTALQARFYADQLEDAWTGMTRLVERAPVNGWLREVRGQISNARDWPRHGLDDFQIATLLNSESLDALAGKAASLMQMYRFEEARPILTRIWQEYPYEHATADVTKQWRFAHKPSYWADITLSNSSGPDLDGRGVLASAELISSPISDVWYASTAYRYAWSEILEGEETFQRTAAGLEYRRGDWDLLGRVTYNDSTRTEMGGSIQAIWQPDDYWRLMLGAERFAVSTPLRALHHDIRADAISGGVTYRTSERRSTDVSLQLSDFTDGNTRFEGGATFRQRFVDIPHLDIDGRIELYGSTNSSSDVPYYSPGHDFSLLGALHADHVYFRHYDHLLAQQLDLGYGVYDQKGYASRWIGHIRYEHRYKFTPWLEALAGLEYGQNVYDGHAEPYHLFRFMINGKF